MTDHLKRTVSLFYHLWAPEHGCWVSGDMCSGPSAVDTLDQCIRFGTTSSKQILSVLCMFYECLLPEWKRNLWPRHVSIGWHRSRQPRWHDRILTSPCLSFEGRMRIPEFPSSLPRFLLSQGWLCFSGSVPTHPWSRTPLREERACNLWKLCFTQLYISRACALFCFQNFS